MLPRLGKYVKYLVFAGALVCLHSLYTNVFGDLTRGYGSSHEYFQSHHSEHLRSSRLSAVSGNQTNATAYPPPDKKASPRWMRDLDTELSGNVSKMVNSYMTRLLNGSQGSCSEEVTHGPSGTTCVPLWQRHLGEISAKGKDGQPYFLTEVLQVRVYEEDKAKWTVAELKQWLHYLFLAGVEHVFVCDHYFKASEMLQVPLKRYIDLGLVTYIPWGEVRHPMTAQIRCYQHIIDKYKDRCQWQLAIDMDEYPWSPYDNKEGFLIRYLRNMTERVGNFLTEISMANYLMIGQGDRERDTVVERINRMTPRPANILVKPIYRPQRVRANVHHNHIISGRPINANVNELRMLHYWGARVQDWGPDTRKTIEISIEMNDVRVKWGPQVRNSLLAFKETNVFNKTTGP